MYMGRRRIHHHQTTMELNSDTKQPDRKKRKSRREQKLLKKKLKTQRNGGSAANLPGDQPSLPQSVDTGDNDDAIDYRSSYIPTTLVSGLPKESNATEDSKSIGKWFPKAEKLKRNPPPAGASCSILLFYQYAVPKLSDRRVEELRLFLLAIGKNRPNLAGRIRIAPEGLNCTLSAASDNPNVPAAATLRYFSYDLQHFDAELFSKTDFKLSLIHI